MVVNRIAWSTSKFLSSLILPNKCLSSLLLSYEQTKHPPNLSPLPSLTSSSKQTKQYPRLNIHIETKALHETSVYQFVRIECFDGGVLGWLKWSFGAWICRWCGDLDRKFVGVVGWLREKGRERAVVGDRGRGRIVGFVGQVSAIVLCMKCVALSLLLLVDRGYIPEKSLPNLFELLQRAVSSLTI